jgi:hypothetical protein
MTPRNAYISFNGIYTQREREKGKDREGVREREREGEGESWREIDAGKCQEQLKVRVLNLGRVEQLHGEQKRAWLPFDPVCDIKISSKYFFNIYLSIF